MNRVCTNCETEQDESQFDIINAATGKRSSWCKSCRSRHAKASYADPTSRRRRSIAKSRETRRAVNLAYVHEKLSDALCRDCGVGPTRRHRLTQVQREILTRLDASGGRGKPEEYGPDTALLPLVVHGFVEQSRGRWPTLSLTDEGRRVMARGQWTANSGLRYHRKNEGDPSVVSLAKDGYSLEVLVKAIADSVVLCKSCATSVYVSRRAPKKAEFACEAAG